MNEKELSELMQNLDYDLIEKEIEELTRDIEIDMESISEKAHKKLKKENLKIMKRKRCPVVAAALALFLSVSSVSVVYGAEISEFVKSFFKQKEIYSTFVDGDAFYLESPVQLDENNRLESLIFTKGELTLRLTSDMKENSAADFEISVVGGDITYEPGGYSVDDNNKYLLVFYNKTANDYASFLPTSHITLNIGNNSHAINLTEGKSVTAKGEIIPAKQPGNGDSSAAAVIDWINLGFRETDKGVQIFTSFADEELKLTAIGNPSMQVVTSMFNREEGASSSTSNLTDALIGYDKDNNAYEFNWDRNATGRPVTVFASNAPKDREIELKVPSLVVAYDYRKEFPKFNIDIPELNQEISLDKEIDFNIQKMVLKSIKRTSATTAELTFDLNTGNEKQVFIRSAMADADNVKIIECTWDEGICTMNITFDGDLKNTNMSIYGPAFVVNGNWSLTLNGQR